MANASWSRFDEAARRAIYFAQEEAKALRVKDVSTEHLLLGLLDDGGTLASEMFWELKIDPVEIRKRVLESARKGSVESFESMALTLEGKRVIDHAFHEAAILEEEHIGTEHLLLGLVAEETGIAARVLKRLGTNLERVREVAKALKGKSTEG